MVNCGCCLLYLLYLVLLISGYRANDSAECMDIVCNNGGTVENSEGFCSCLCPQNTTGLLCDYQLQESAFPRGPFALPMSKDGCPEEIAQGWTTGFVNITTAFPIDKSFDYSCGSLKESVPSKQTGDIGETYMLGPFDRYTLQLNFCFKTVGHTLNSDTDWPSGLYGIYGTEEGCPSGFNELHMSLCLPRLLHYNMDGSLPKLNIEENDSSAVLNTTYCRRIADSAVDTEKLSPFFKTSNPVVLIKDPEMTSEACHVRKGYNVTEENYPLQLVFSDGNTYFQLHFCRYVPVTYDTATKPWNVFPGTLLPFLDISLHVRSCGDDVVGMIMNSCEEVEVWVMIDAGKTVQVSGVMWSYQKKNDTNLRKQYDNLTHVFVGSKPWSFLHHGSLLCGHHRPKTNNLQPDFKEIYMCTRSFLGRYVTLVFRFVNFDESNIFNDVMMYILSNDDKFALADNGCSEQIGMRNLYTQDFQITASSYQDMHTPSSAQLWIPGLSGWCAQVHDKNPFIQVDIGMVSIISGVTVSNWDNFTYVNVNNTYKGTVELYGAKSFSIEYGTNQNYMRQYNREGFVYDQSQQVGVPQTFLLQRPILAKYVRIYPKASSPSERTCLKFELLGCKFGFDKNINNKIRLDKKWNPYFVSKVKTADEYMIQSEGFPGKEDKNSFIVWKILKQKQQYIKLDFYDIHLRLPKEVTGEFLNQKLCKDSIFISTSEIKNPFVDINDGGNIIHLDSLYNGRVPQFLPTQQKGESVYLSSFVCSTHEVRDEDGAAFSVLASYTDYSFCIDECASSDMKLITGNFLGQIDIPKIQLHWKIASYGKSIAVIITIEDFDVSCYTGSEFYINNQKYCNQNVSSEEKTFWFGFVGDDRTPRIDVRFDKQNNILESSNAFPEGLKISYALVSLSSRTKLENLKVSIYTKWVTMNACSMEFGKCYYFDHGNSKTWIDVAKHCEEQGYLMINFNSPEEYRQIRSTLQYFYHLFIQANIIMNMDVFIGLSRYVDTSGRLKEQWTDGSPLSFTAWGENEPSDVGLKECTMMKLFSDVQLEGTNSWYTASCDHVFEEEAIYICEEDYRDAVQVCSSDMTDNWLLEDITSKLDPAVLFECSSGEWMSHMVRCNGLKECRDGSDEMNCTVEFTECDGNEFTCTDGQCIHISQVCDHRVDCSDSSDEYCSFPECDRKTEYTCDNGQCIELTARCDSFSDCFDGSDEISCSRCNLEKAFQCGDKTCISKRLVCDKMNDCPDAADERSCDQKYQLCYDFLRDGYINSKEYKTDEGLHIICYLDTFSMDVYMTIRNSDWAFNSERQFRIIIPDTLQAATRRNYTCMQTISRIPQRERFPDHPYGNEDLRGYVQRSYRGLWSQIKGGQPSFWLDFITRTAADKQPYQSGSFFTYSLFTEITGLTVTLYDNFTSLKDRISIGNIECYKDFNPTQSLLPCGRGYKAISQAERCLYNLHSNRLIDGCRSLNHLQNCGDFSCPWDYFKCRNSYCIPQTYVCNGYADCPNAEDETVCSCSDRELDVIGIFVPSSSFIPEKRANKLYELAFSLGGSFFTPNRTIHVLRVSKGQSQTSLTLDKTRILSKSERMTKNYYRYNIEHDDSILQTLFGNSTKTFGLVWLLDESEFSEAEHNLAAKLGNISDIVYFHRLVIDSKIEKEGNYVKRSKIYDKELTLKKQDVLGTLGAFLFPDLCEGESFRCIGHFRCKLSTVCIEVTQVCDGTINCPFGDDEDYCNFQCPEGCRCGALILDCSHMFMNYTIRISPNTRAVDSSFSHQLCVSLLRDQLYTLPVLFKLNVSNCQLEEINRYSFQNIQNLLVLDISFNRLRELKHDTFSLLTRLQSLYLANNKLLKEIEPGAFNGLQIKSLFINHANIRTLVKNTFAGLNLTILDLSKNKIKSVENFAFSGLETNQINIENNEITEFSDGLFDGIENLAYLKTSSFKFCCVRPPYLSEENCYPPKDEFSSCEHLMRNITLKALLWTIGSLALVGNILSIFVRLAYDRARLKLGYGVFVSNLAISDLLMGIYLLSIAIADKIFEGRYVEFDEYWRQSVWCQCAGILATLSSEASVLLMVLITIDRIIVIKFPFGKVRFNTNSAVISALGCWLAALTVALIPIFYKKYFKNFYGKSAVCLALPLTGDRPQGWLFSLILFIGFNMLAFVLIAVGQWLIYKEVKKSAKVKGKREHAARTSDLKIARNLLLIVSTDFLCWFPIGFMGFLSMAGYEVPDIVYAWTAVLVLPFNSALNPFLYTFISILGKKNLTPNVKEQEPMENKEVTPEAMLNVTRFLCNHAKPRAGKLLTLSEVLQDHNLMMNEILDLSYNVIKYVALLEECCLTLEDVNEHKLFLQLRKNSRVRVNTLFIGKPVQSMKKTQQAENIYRFGVFLEKILKTR